MSQIVDFSTSNSQVTDEVINVANSNPINLQHDIFYNKVGKAVVVSTGAGGTGTVLTDSTDYTIGGSVADSFFPASISPDVGYTTVAITNATYHSTDLYVSYYPISDVFKASRFNAIFTPPSLGDFDISTTDATISMAVPNSYPIGYRFRVSWHSGDGSNNFTFTDVAGLTLDGIAFTEWVGQGTGHLNLVKTAVDTWQTFDTYVWDTDGGNFSGVFEKTVSGVQKTEQIERKNNGASSPQTYNHVIAYGLVTSHMITQLEQDGLSGTDVRIDVSVPGDYSGELNSFKAYVVTSSGLPGDFTRYFVAKFTGRWTTSYPSMG